MEVSNTEIERINLDHGNGLILRRGNERDADALAEFNSVIHTEDENGKPDEFIKTWVLDLATKPHPTSSVNDFTVVEEIKTGKIVSSMNLISQSWSYENISFNVGRPELVGTAPEFRGRGLIRKQFKIIHQWSSERGEILQAITGIPYYYRQFGYEMAVSLGGGRYGYKPQVKHLKEGETEPYLIRQATEDDINFIGQVYNRSCQRYLLSCDRGNDSWVYELSGRSPKNIQRLLVQIIEDKSGNPVGFFSHPSILWGPYMSTTYYELNQDQCWTSVTPSVIRYLYRTGEQYTNQQEKTTEFSGFGFRLGGEHPVYDLLGNNLPLVRNPYTWFIRLSDIPGFLNKISSVLEERLAGSHLKNCSDSLNISFYRKGIHLELEGGKIKNITPWTPQPHGHSGDAAFPPLTFLQLIFGYRSIEELKHAYADCSTKNDQISHLLNTLFPKKASNIWPIS